MNNKTKSAFLVPFFGKLPKYFDFWVKSCEINKDNFHWFVYSDAVKTTQKLNNAVSIIPFTFDEMRAQFEKKLGIVIKGRLIRRVCDYRLLFYFIRKEQENLNKFDFIGYTDVDMVYGEISKYLPKDMDQYSMISAHDDRPCGPFTLMNRSQMHYILEWEGIKEEMERERHQSFNESLILKELLSTELPAFCKANPLQPQRATLHFRHHYGIWEDGKVVVHDCFFRKQEGAFYHFSRHKRKKNFKIDPNVLNSESWGVYRGGIITAKPLSSKLKFLSTVCL